MKNYLNISILMLLSFGVFAQNKQNSFKQSFSGADKRVVILSASNNLTIEGIAGTEVIIESDKQEREFPEEAQGLKIVSPGGATDNTGIGANVVLEGNTLRIKLPKSKYFGNFVVKVPKDLSVSLKENGNAYGKWLITGMKGEVEAETSYSTLNIKNVSGPIVARGGYGKMYIEYDQLNQSRPNSISASGAVDITLPADAKANLKVQATYADFFTDFDIMPTKVDLTENNSKKNVWYTTYNNQTVYVNANGAYDRYGKKFPEADYNKIIESEASKKDKLVKGQSTDLVKDLAKVKEQTGKSFMSADDVVNQLGWKKNTSSDDCNCPDDGSITGTINGGGVNIVIKSDHGNVYLRKMK